MTHDNKLKNVEGGKFSERIRNLPLNIQCKITNVQSIAIFTSRSVVFASILYTENIYQQLAYNLLKFNQYLTSEGNYSINYFHFVVWA